MLVKYKKFQTISTVGLQICRLTQLYPQIECEIERPCAQIPQFAHAAHDGPTISDSERGNCVTIPFSPSMSHMHLAPTPLPYPQIEATQRVGLQVQKI